MRSEKELKEFLKKCVDAPREGNGSTTENCPIDGDNYGCCAECSFPSAIEWVLGANNNPSHNLQQKVISFFQG